MVMLYAVIMGDVICSAFIVRILKNQLWVEIFKWNPNACVFLPQQMAVPGMENHLTLFFAIVKNHCMYWTSSWVVCACVHMCVCGILVVRQGCAMRPKCWKRVKVKLKYVMCTVGFVRRRKSEKAYCVGWGIYLKNRVVWARSQEPVRGNGTNGSTEFLAGAFASQFIHLFFASFCRSF